MDVYVYVHVCLLLVLVGLTYCKQTLSKVEDKSVVISMSLDNIY